LGTVQPLHPDVTQIANSEKKTQKQQKKNQGEPFYIANLFFIKLLINYPLKNKKIKFSLEL